MRRSPLRTGARGAIGVLSAVLAVGSGCALVAGVKDGQLAATDGGSGSAGDGSTSGEVSVRGVDQFQSDNTQTFTLKPAPLTEAGDFTWVVILRTGHPPPEMTVPDGFDKRQTTSFACGSRASALDVYSRMVVGPEPPSFDFSVASDSGISAILVTFSGLSGMVEAGTFVNSLGNPITLEPLANGDNPSFGLAVFTGAGGFATDTFSIPPGRTRIVEAHGVAVFGDDVAPRDDFTNDSVNKNPEGCGFGYAALLARR